MIGTVVEYASVKFLVEVRRLAEKVSHLKLGVSIRRPGFKQRCCLYISPAANVGRGQSRSRDPRLPAVVYLLDLDQVYVSAGRVASPVWTLES